MALHGRLTALERRTRGRGGRTIVVAAQCGRPGEPGSILRTAAGLRLIVPAAFNEDALAGLTDPQREQITEFDTVVRIRRTARPIVET